MEENKRQDLNCYLIVSVKYIILYSTLLIKEVFKKKVKFFIKQK